MSVNQKFNTRGVFITQSKIYDGACLRKQSMFFAKNFIIDVQVGSKYYFQ